MPGSEYFPQNWGNFQRAPRDSRISGSSCIIALAKCIVYMSAQGTVGVGVATSSAIFSENLRLDATLAKVTSGATQPMVPDRIAADASLRVCSAQFWRFMHP